ncbi:unnamed protein product [Nezara viridula]|uniref:Secreted protein n=1 Tax=Nezara viridula TaxID=85310 RepID=A0A9P0H8A2_NEZVI|nr:unnamed protein product [Nezara viridula]
MSAILLLLLASSVCGFDVPTSAANRFFDTLLEKSFNRQPSDRKVPDRTFGFLGISLQLGDIIVSGPSMLKRQGDAEMEQITFSTQAYGAINLGKIDYAIRNLVIDIFGHKITTAVTFTLEEASTTSRVYVVQRDRANCEGTTFVSEPSGKRKVRFQSQNGLYKILENVASVLVDYHLLSVGDVFHFADLTKYLENEFNKSSNEIFC